MRRVVSGCSHGPAPREGSSLEWSPVRLRLDAIRKNIDGEPWCRYDYRVTSKSFESMKSAAKDKGRVSVTVRIPEHILKRIDSSLEQEDVPVSRNHWVIEALVEKLRRTGAGGESNGAQ